MDAGATGNGVVAKHTETAMECMRLRAENEDLKRRLEETRRVTVPVSPAGNPSLRRDTPDAADRLIAELQRRLWDALQRNSILEQQSHAQHTALIQTYDGYIKRLEDEIRQYRLLLKQRQS